LADAVRAEHRVKTQRCTDIDEDLARLQKLFNEQQLWFVIAITKYIDGFGHTAPGRR
jgi:hypothetical protein